MAKIELYKKRYAIHGKVEMSVLIPINNAKLRVNFANGVINSNGITPATFSTSDPVVQTAIENNRLYQKGLIKLDRKWKIGEVEEAKEEVSGSESSGDESSENGTPKYTIYPDVKNAQSAREVLIRDYNVSLAELQDKERIKNKAEELKVKFPNWN